jgi:phospholipid:diacylglycerol acyltransferase
MTDRCVQYLAPYDWRLSYSNLEERDGYFSRLKVIIEGFKYVYLSCSRDPEIVKADGYARQRQNQKVVLAAHSMGSSVSTLFQESVANR